MSPACLTPRQVPSVLTLLKKSHSNQIWWPHQSESNRPACVDLLRKGFLFRCGHMPACLLSLHLETIVIFQPGRISKIQECPFHCSCPGHCVLLREYGRPCAEISLVVLCGSDFHFVQGIASEAGSPSCASVFDFTRSRWM